MDIEIDPYNDPSRIGGSIQTFSGHVYYPLDPREEDIFLEDTAHSLSCKARYTGHTKKFYSVAEHSVRVSWLLAAMGFDPMTQYVGLHHDDSDSVLPDVPTPLKVLPEFAWFREIEDKNQEKFFNRYGCVIVDYSPVKRADTILLLTEKRDLMPKVNSNWGKHTELPIPYPYRIRPWLPERAEKEWLARNEVLREILSKADPSFRCDGIQTLP